MVAFFQKFHNKSTKNEESLEDLPKRYIRLAHRDHKRDLELNKYFTDMYVDLFSKKSWKERKFINFGPGSFKHKFWQNADRYYQGKKSWSDIRDNKYKMQIDIEWNLLENKEIDVESDTIEVCYCSHLIEHAWDDNVRFFFKDVHRVLKEGGVFRVVCPDIDLGIEAYRNKDKYFFINNKSAQPIPYKLLEYNSLITHKENSTCLSPDEADDFIKKHKNEYEALNEASRLSDKEVQNKYAAHVNWFNEEKVVKFLKDAGFKTIRVNGYKQSICPVLRDARYFDKTDPEVSLYIDAIK